VTPPGHANVPSEPPASPAASSAPGDPVPVSPAPASAAPRPNASYPGTGRLVGLPSPPPPPTAPASGGNGIQLAFADVDIPQVVASVLGEALGLNYSIDPSVKGTMSLRSSRPLSNDELLPALEAALRMQDLALVETHGTYQVVPMRDAPRRVASLNLPTDRNQTGFSIQIVPLDYTSPAEMEKILQPFAPAGGVMKVDEARNLLVLAGSSQELETMLGVVKMFDVDWLSGMSYGFFSLDYVDAKTAVSELQDIFADPKSPLAGVVRLVPLTRLNTILVITPQQKYLQAVETWIKRLDVGGTSAGRRIYVYDVQNGRAEDLAKSLSKILSLPTSADDMAPVRGAPGTMSPSSGYGFGASGGVTQGSGFTPVYGAPGTSGIPNYGNESGAPAAGAFPGSNPANLANASKPGDLRIIANNDSNSLLVLATPAEFSVIEAALGRLDAPVRQVLIEASLAEVTLTDEFRYGVQWNFANKNGPVTLSDTGTIAQAFPGLSYLYTGSNSISAVLNALESLTKVRVISSPKLLTLNNHEALLQVGDSVPIATQSAISTATAGAPIVNSIQMQDTGVILTVTPRVNKNGLVQLDISQEVSASTETTTSNIDSPTIQQRKFTSTVVVKNGDTIALGGLITESITKARSGVPVLENIPLLGNLFRDTHNTTTRTELILLITPRVLRDDTEFQGVMDDLRSEFKSLKDVFVEPPKKK
jgi:general secretion pathway protein D